MWGQLCRKTLPNKRLNLLKPERDAYQTALDLLARREHSRVELYNKLSKKGFFEEQCERALDLLVANGLQSDQRFIEGFVRSRVLKGNGPLRICHELRIRGIDDDLFSRWMDEQSIDWLEVATNIYTKRYGLSETTDARERAKRMRFMQSKGFPSGIIWQVIKI